MTDLARRDLRHIWHPCSQMKDYEAFLPLQISGASGSYLHLADGTRIIDAISSWWCKSLGHGHHRLRAALKAQADKFEHVILANTTNELIVELSEKLTSYTKNLDKVFYGGDGSTAVEVSLKMALQAQQLRGNKHRTRFAALKNGYHGESAGALGVSGLGLYRDQYEALLPQVDFLPFIPYVTGADDPLWSDCSGEWARAQVWLGERAGTMAGLILEPIVQGAGGMLIYSADFLKRLRKWSHENDVYLIVDEILTGFGRTGRRFAFEYADMEPDFLCLSKALTGGWLPFCAMLTRGDIYDLFYDDYETGKSFLHSNTFTGNALGAAVALEALKIYDEEKIWEKAAHIQELLQKSYRELSRKTGLLKNIRGIGAVIAADLVLPGGLADKRMGYLVYRQAVKRGALLRPLGNTIYWFLPLNVEKGVIEELTGITESSLKAVFR